VPIVDLMQLQTRDPFKVLITTILSARTNDKTTAHAAKRLFERIDSVEELDSLSEKTIAGLIYPVGFYHMKAKHLKELPRQLQEKYNGDIPDTVEELIRLPGVGRKTANLVVAVAFGKPAICVDTHVHRIMNRFGYIRTKNPFETEMTLRKKLPIQYWTTINSILVAFGQHLCTPIGPKCSMCPVHMHCKRVGVMKSR
jgi:endonuclease III